MNTMNVQVWIQIWGFVIAIALILAGILFNRQDVKELRSELNGQINGLRSELGGKMDRLQADLTQFYRIIGQHDARIENLEKGRS